MSHATTRAPERANANPEARPMPEPAPVTSATLPSNCLRDEAVTVAREEETRRVDRAIALDDGPP
jgi:hypothetical protein